MRFFLPFKSWMIEVLVEICIRGAPRFWPLLAMYLLWGFQYRSACLMDDGLFCSIASESIAWCAGDSYLFPFQSPTTRSDVLESETNNYGHGSIMRQHQGGYYELRRVRRRRALNPEEVKRAGNEQYRMGHFAEALGLYERAIAISPGNDYRANQAAALAGLGWVGEAVRLDPTYARAHHRLGSLLIRYKDNDFGLICVDIK